MAGFYIKEIRATGQSIPDAVVSFCPGLNILQGRSETGKTCVLKCIDFAFGGNTTKPFKDGSGYSAVKMIVANGVGEVSISRKVGKNQFTVESGIEGIEDGVYNLKPDKKGLHPVLNLVWMKLMGIEEEHLVPVDLQFKKKRMTWKQLLRMFYIDEDDIITKLPIIPPEQYTEITGFLSALLFLITGQDFSEQDANEKKELRKQRKKAVTDYITEKIQGAVERKKLLEEQLGVFQGIDVEAEIDRMVAELEAVEASITAALAQTQQLLNTILQEEEKVTESELLLSRFTHLRSQYTADIKRLTFIVEGEQTVGAIPHATTCPFCDGAMPARSKKSYIEAARAELNRIITQLQGLSATEADVEKEHSSATEHLSQLRAQRSDIESVITSELRPRASALSDSIKAYRAYIQAHQEVAVIADFAQSWERDIDRYETEAALDDKKLEYRPREYFPEDFQTTMTQYAEEILQECRYEGFTCARFNVTTFDIEVNGQEKKTFGKGYRAYLNTVVALMFRRYLANHAMYGPRLLIIDTPLHGLDDGVDVKAPESMRAGLYTYFMNHQEEGQLIVVENLDNIPDLDYSGAGAKVETFTHGKSKGRYGFLHGVK